MTDTSAVLSITTRITGDVLSFGIVLGTLAQILPPLAALISILWIGFQFYNSEPFQTWLKKRKDK
jgi:hypothetical protein